MDIRQHGSGNAGGTNVMRVLGWKVGLAVILVDLFKGVVATIFIARLFWDPSLPFQNRTPFEDFTVVQIICGMAAILGHIWTLFAGFKGGKGVATGLGVLLAYMWPAALGAAATWLIVAVLFRYSSLAAVSAAISAPLWAWIFAAEPTQPLVVLAIVLVVLWRHQGNIGRLLRGEESKISFKKTSA